MTLRFYNLCILKAWLFQRLGKRNRWGSTWLYMIGTNGHSFVFLLKARPQSLDKPDWKETRSFSHYTNIPLYYLKNQDFLFFSVKWPVKEYSLFKINASCEDMCLRVDSQLFTLITVFLWLFLINYY